MVSHVIIIFHFSIRVRSGGTMQQKGGWAEPANIICQTFCCWLVTKLQLPVNKNMHNASHEKT
jgi:hypothetical protein